MKNKTNTLLLFVGSVGLILIAIVFTSVIDKTKSNSRRSDTRARAGKAGTMLFLGTVSYFDENNNVLVVDKLMFEDSDNKSLGTWTVTPPASFNPAKFGTGTNVRITANPVSFQINSKTLTASEIDKR